MSDPRPEAQSSAPLERNRDLVASLARTKTAGLRAVARRGGISGDQVDDVVQSALLGVLRAYRGPADPDQLYRYAARAVANEARHAHRRFARKESHLRQLPDAPQEDGGHAGDLADADARDPLECLLARESVAARRARVLRLPRLERSVIVLRACGFSLVEIGRAVGISERGVRKRITAANALLRE